MQFHFGFGVNKKLDDLATIIGETTMGVPLDISPITPPRERTLEQEVISSIDDLKAIAQVLAQSSNPRDRQLARRILINRSAFKLLARTHFPAKPPVKE